MDGIGGCMKKINIWKYLFFFLLALIIGGGIFLIKEITSKREDIKVVDEYKAWDKKDAAFLLSMNKEQVNKLINKYLSEFLDNETIKYGFILEERALFTGQYKIFDEEVSFYLYFEPNVLEDGNVLLKAKSLSIGTLEIPISTIMSYIKNNYSLPEWVVVDAENESITLNLDKITFNNMAFKAKQINLLEDKIIAEVFLK